MKQIQASELIKSDELVREPVDDFSNKILNSNSKKIVLTGGRGIGKSVILYNIELKGLGTEKQTILVNFGSIMTLPKEYDEIFDEKFINHFYEVQFCSKILNYIKRNYSLTYETYFKYYEQLLKNINEKTCNYINNSIFEKVTLDSYIKPTQFSETILKNLKAYLGISSISLAIDRFDWINGSSSIPQKVLYKFFEMFDKVIITSDDETIKKDNLINSGYEVIDVNYGKNELVIKEIIRKRIKKYNENKKICYLTFPDDNITNEIYHRLINKTNGNISCMLNCVSEVITDWQIENGNIDLNEQFDKESEQQLIKIKKIKNMDANQPKLYI